MLASCGLALGAATFDLKPPADAKAWAGENIQPGAIHFALCASTSMREWPVAHWTELAHRIWKHDPSAQIIATAGYNDRERAVLKAFASRLTNQNLRTFGRLTIPQLTAAMQRCALHVGSDSGPLHLARACDLPTVSFFRTYQGIEGWLPRGEMHSTFVAPCDCTSGQHRPCEKTGTPRCLNAIKVDEVFAAVRNLRGGGSAII
jgi:ADP-heptose:LPS heptosyltransferase